MTNIGVIWMTKEPFWIPQRNGRPSVLWGLSGLRSVPAMATPADGILGAFVAMKAEP
jgi:hypothetical protein